MSCNAGVRVTYFYMKYLPIIEIIFLCEMLSFPVNKKNIENQLDEFFYVIYFLISCYYQNRQSINHSCG